MLASPGSLDERIFRSINEDWTCAALDWATAVVRASEMWILPFLLVLAFVAWRGSPRTRGVAILCVAVFAIGDGLCVRPAKALVGRARPDAVLNVRSVRLAPSEPRILALAEPLVVARVGPRDRERSMRSFPSGHAWNTFAVATVLALSFRRWGWLAYAPAAGVAYTRVHAGLHWPSDVLASALLAVPAAAILSIVIDRGWRHIVAPRFPRLGRHVPALLPRRPEA